MCTDFAATSGSTPRATLTISTDAIDLKGTLGTFHIPRAAVERAHRARLYPWVFGGLRIRHHVKDCSKLLQFCPVEARTRDILAALKALGYPVT